MSNSSVNGVGNVGPGRQGSLDVARLVAVFCVFGAHQLFIPFSGRLHEFWWKNDVGSYGVAVFFVISGYVITHVLLKDKREGLSCSNFMVRRVLRIFPAYFVYLIFLTYVVGSAGAKPVPLQSWLYLWNYYAPWCGPQGYGYLIHTWTLCVEAQFYLLWPVIVFFLDREKATRLAIAGILFAISYGVAAYIVSPNGAHLTTSVQFFPLCAGALIALRPGFCARPLARRLPLPLLAAGILIHWLSFSFLVGHFPADKLLPASLFEAGYLWRTVDLQGYLLEYSRTAIGLSVVLFCLLTVEQQPWAGRLRVWWLQDLGMMTYGIYLYHLYIFSKMGIFMGDGSVWLAAAAVAVTLAVAAVSFYSFEKPLINLGRWLRHRAKEAQAMSAPAQKT
jgi:peptidoglycan/LPS O-acetylase OafA/YrhL